MITDLHEKIVNDLKTTNIDIECIIENSDYTSETRFHVRLASGDPMAIFIIRDGKEGVLFQPCLRSQELKKDITMFVIIDVDDKIVKYKFLNNYTLQQAVKRISKQDADRTVNVCKTNRVEILGKQTMEEAMKEAEYYREFRNNKKEFLKLVERTKDNTDLIFSIMEDSQFTNKTIDKLVDKIKQNLDVFKDEAKQLINKNNIYETSEF